MGTISQSDLKKVFTAVDARMIKKLDVYVIGGAAAILGYNVIKETNDVDLEGVIGNPREKKMNLLDLISMLFGVDEMEKSKNKINF